MMNLHGQHDSSLIICRRFCFRYVYYLLVMILCFNPTHVSDCEMKTLNVILRHSVKAPTHSPHSQVGPNRIVPSLAPQKCNQTISYEEEWFGDSPHYLNPHFASMKTGVLFDAWDLQQNKDIPHPLYRMGDTIHSLIHSLSPDPILDNTNSSDDWEERFDSLLSSLQQDYHEQFFSPPPMCVNQQRGNTYSSLRVSRSLPHLSFLMEADNICYSPSTDSFLFSTTRNERVNTYHFVNDYYSNSIVTSDNFAWGWSFNPLYGRSFSSNIQWQNDEGVAVVKPPFDNHIFHALEGLGFLWVKLIDPASLPPISTFLLPHYRHSDMEWITQINQIIFSLFPKNVSFVWDSGLQGRSRCFRHILLLDRMKEFFDGGFLPGFSSADLLRAAVYRRFGLKIPKSSKIVATLFARTNTRRWKNQTFVREHIQRRFGSVLALEEYTYKATSLQEQVAQHLKTELAIAPHGAGLTNLIFMRPYSVLVELMPPQFYDGGYVALTKHCRIHHILIGCFKPIPRSDFDIDEMYWEERFFEVRYHYKSLDLDTNPLLLLGGIEDGIEYLRHQRYYFQRNNIESVIFPFHVCDTQDSITHPLDR